MIEDIRKKHEEQKKLWAGFEFPERIRSIYSIADVDALFKELDAERGKAKTVVAYVEDVLIGSDHDYAGKRIIEILTGEG